MATLLFGTPDDVFACHQGWTVALIMLCILIGSFL